MRYLILSDIHSNLHAFEAFMKEAGQKGYDYMVCLGDIVGYGAFPNECIEAVSDTADYVILGNHDEAALGGDISFFNPYAKAAVQWTRKKLSRSGKSYLKKLPMKYEAGIHEFVHSSPANPSSWQYIMSVYNAQNALAATGKNRIFIGHTHIPVIYENYSGCTRMEFAGEYILNEERRYIINAGSVGQPRNSDNRACGLIYDAE